MESDWGRGQIVGIAEVKGLLPFAAKLNAP